MQANPRLQALAVLVGDWTTVGTHPMLPGKTFHGRVSYILPQVDPATRTLKVRIQFDNPGTVLKPEMYGDVEFQTGGARKLMVPQNAVLNSGMKQVVFVDRGNGYLEPRDVKVGRLLDSRYEILSGLDAGERIVTSGNFLIDSESQLKAASADSEPRPAGSGHATSPTQTRDRISPPARPRYSWP